jgi:FAD:protein FMN transferase
VVVAIVEAANLAVATSGAYLRGEHVVDPRTGRAPSGLASVTVIGPGLALTDAYATAALARGRDGVDWIAGMDGYGVFAVLSGSPDAKGSPGRAVSDREFARYRA